MRALPLRLAGLWLAFLLIAAPGAGPRDAGAGGGGGPMRMGAGDTIADYGDSGSLPWGTIALILAVAALIVAFAISKLRKPA